MVNRFFARMFFRMQQRVCRWRRQLRWRQRLRRRSSRQHGRARSLSSYPKMDHNGSSRNDMDAAPLHIPIAPTTLLLWVVTTTKTSTSVVARQSLFSQQKKEGQTRTLPSMMTPRSEHTLILVENRFIVAMGGESNGSRIVSSVEYVDLEEEPQEQEQWRPLPSPKTARRSFAAFYSPKDHKIVILSSMQDTRSTSILCTRSK